MKKTILFWLLLLFSTSVFSQSAFKKGQKNVDIGIGLGNPYWGSGTTNTLPVNPRLSWESGISDDISIGASIALSSSKYEYLLLGQKYGWKYNGYFIAGRGSYHFKVNEKVDPYIGGTVGYVIVSVKEIGPEAFGTATALGSGVGYGGYAGIRYYLKPKLALNAELGYTSFSFLTAGISLKL